MKDRGRRATERCAGPVATGDVSHPAGMGVAGATAEADPPARGVIASVTLAITAEEARQLAEARRTGELDVLLLPPPPEVAHP